MKKMETKQIEEIGLILAIIAILLAIFIPVFQFLWKKFLTVPYLTIEIKNNGGHSLPAGISRNSPLTSEGHIDANKAIRYYELTWQLQLIITNNSDFSAFFPKIDFPENSILLKELDKLNILEPIKSGESKTLNYQYIFIEEAGPGQRTEMKSFPKQIENLKILLKYENGQKAKFYTLFSFVNRYNQPYKWKAPKIYTS